MNIMLATVTERTREIESGEPWERNDDIIQQFITETLVLTGGGGLLGVIFGLLCGPIFEVPDRCSTLLNRIFSPSLTRLSQESHYGL